MELQRGYSFRLYATEDQERIFAQWAGTCRAVYNAALFQRQHFSRKGRFVGFHENAADCGSIDARNRESQAQFRCIECGHEAHADCNAAINILRAGTRPSERAKVRCRKSRIAA
jgi:transposase